MSLYILCLYIEDKYVKWRLETWSEQEAPKNGEPRMLQLFSKEQLNIKSQYGISVELVEVTDCIWHVCRQTVYQFEALWDKVSVYVGDGLTEL